MRVVGGRWQRAGSEGGGQWRASARGQGEAGTETRERGEGAGMVGGMVRVDAKRMG